MKNNKKGFTLVELVIVVAVMAVLVAVAIPTVSSIVGTAEQSVAESNAKTIESMIKLELAEKSVEDGSEASLGSTDIDNAITDAKLGIDGAFEYDSVTGTVTAIDEDEAVITDEGLKAVDKTTFYIVCDADAEATEAEGTTPAATALDNSVKVYQGTKGTT